MNEYIIHILTLVYELSVFLFPRKMNDTVSICTIHSAKICIIASGKGKRFSFLCRTFSIFYYTLDKYLQDCNSNSNFFTSPKCGHEFKNKQKYKDNFITFLKVITKGVTKSF